MTDYDVEAVDRLPFTTPEKSQRYRTENYRGAVGLNWYETDPSLQLTMAYYLQPDELAIAEPHLRRIGELMGGPVARWAEQTDRNPPRLERYDRWGHDISEVVQPTSFTESKTAVLAAQKALKDDARRAGVNPSLPLFAANYLLDQADIGMGCALGTGGGMVKSLVAAYAPADVRDHVLAKFETGEWEGETAQLLTERAGGSDLGALETTATPAWRCLAAERFQVVRLQLRRAGVRRAGQAGRRTGFRPRRGELPGAADPPGRLAQRHPHPPPEGQARHPVGGLRRGGVRRRRSLPAVRRAERPVCRDRGRPTVRGWAG